MVSQVIRYSDIKARGVINNRATLSRWIKRYGFPPGFLYNIIGFSFDARWILVGFTVAFRWIFY